MCDICVSDYDTLEHKEVICPYCHKSVCVNCVSNFLLTINDYHCMYCKKTWSKEMLYDMLPKHFIDTTLKTHREKVLLDKQISLLPETQLFVEAILHDKCIKKKMKILSKNENALLRKERSLHIYRNRIHRILLDKVYNTRKGRLFVRNKYKESDTIFKKMNEIVIEYTKLHNSLLYESPNKPLKSEFIKKCPNNDCRGFLNKDYTCKLCNGVVCKKCEEVLNCNGKDEHICNPEIIKNIKAIKKDTKACPKCGINIFKIDGCDQMWCTGCQTAFSWENGNIIVGVIHNPHFYEFQRRNGGIVRNQGDVLCGGLPIIPTFSFSLSSSYMKQIFDILYDVINVLNGDNINVANYDNEMRHNRELYLLNKINLHLLSCRAQVCEKESEYNLSMTQLRNMFIETSTDIAQRFYAEVTKDDVTENITTTMFGNDYPDNFRDIIDYQKFATICYNTTNELNTLCDYYKECYQKIIKNFSKKPMKYILGEYYGFTIFNKKITCNMKMIKNTCEEMKKPYLYD